MPAVIESNAHKVHIFNNLCRLNFSYIYRALEENTVLPLKLGWSWAAGKHGYIANVWSHMPVWYFVGLFSKQKEPSGLQKYNRWIHRQFIEWKTASQGTYTIHVNVLWHTCIPCMHLILQILQPFYISWDFCFQLMTIHLFVFLFIDWFYTSLEKQTCISDFFFHLPFNYLFIYLFTYWLIDWFVCLFICLCINLHWASKETYHFFRVSLTEIQSIKMNHIWTQIR